MSSAEPVAFKATRFRLNTSTQYADQLWLKNVSTVASPATMGTTDSVKAAYLPNGDGAVPTIFGVMNWQAPLSGNPSECNIKVLDSASSTLETALKLTNDRAQFSGMVASSQGMEIGSGASAPWRMTVDPVTGSLLFLKYNSSTGVYEEKHAIST